MVDAEAQGALEAAKWMVTNRIQAGTICVDNTAVVKSLTEFPTETSQLRHLQTLTLLRSVRRGEIRWVPGYESILGNEVADRLAKKGANTPYVTTKGEKITLSHAKRPARHQAR